MSDVKERSLKTGVKGVFQVTRRDINLRISLKNNNITVDCDNLGRSRADAAVICNIIKLAADILYGEAIHQINIEQLAVRNAIYGAHDAK
jgi:hypothetical protein